MRGPTVDEPGQRGLPPAQPSLVRNVLSNWTATALTIVYSLVITPIVVRALDRELYGIWSFLNALVAYSNILYLGLGSALVRYAAQYHASADRAAFNRLVSVVLTIYSLVGTLFLACMVIASPYTPSLFAGALGGAAARAAIITTVLLGARVFLMFVGSVFAGVLIAEGRTDLNSSVAVAGTVARFVAVPIFVRGPNPLEALAAVVVVTAALETVGQAALAFRLDPGLRARAVRPAAQELRMLYGFGFFAFLLQIGERIISYTDTTVIGVVLGAASVALYALPLQLSEYARIVVYGIVSVLLPHLTALETQGKKSELAEAYLSSVRAASFVSAFLNVNLVFLGSAFLGLWVGAPFADAAPAILVCLGAAGYLQSIATQSQWPFCAALNVLRFPVAIMLVEALANLTLSIVLARPLGIAGVAVATAVPTLLGTTLFVPQYVARRIGVPLSRLAREGAGPSLVLILALSMTHWALHAAFLSSSYLALAGKAVATVPVALAVGALVFPLSERDRAVAAVRTAAGRMLALAH